ncbi:MAG: UDP-2,3-diacylglucosamine diphosphatase [Bacteroidales bacterium]|nr:UDP-2,3-diacylglucosamine diphosphatase [Bacteroidales bacterium]
MHHKTIIISDVHLGTKDAKTRELSKFLKFNTCDRLILNGDIVDMWHLKRRGKWEKKDTRVFRRIIRMMKNYNTEVIYIRGNHDDFLDQFIPLQIGKFSVVSSFDIISKGKRYFVTHGDVFDAISTRFRWIAQLGDKGYKLLLWINRRHNNIRRFKGLPYSSLSQKIKQKVKIATRFISDYEITMADFARRRNYDGIICGHIHKAEILDVEGIKYMNSGDWVESFSALVEDHDENWQVVFFQSVIPVNDDVEAG